MKVKLNHLHRWIWTPRISHKAIVFQEDVYVLAGRQADGNGTSSMWYRDDVLPTVTFTLVPKDGSSQSNFSFLCSEDGCIFEYENASYQDFNKLIIENVMLIQVSYQ